MFENRSWSPGQRGDPSLPRRRLIVGISGATGIVYGVRLLQILRELDVESHLVVSRAGELTRAYETAHSAADLRKLADVSYRASDVGAAISSGSFRTMGMVVAPCSIRTLSEIATGVTGTLLTRAADVCLKERRRLVLMVRETPLHAGHLKSMLAVTEAGGIIAPPVPAFYNRPQSLDEMVHHTVARVLDLFDLDTPTTRRWGETSGEGSADAGPPAEGK
ncbi:UbiX family flavin prenyltransferase [Singulisphaera sp. Ch08]|uniref:Flavin prenyltransferase UbiX n=1 Tax=Singulisphaera sp. Ch08 TaxID=3120278 RepID=A0AAU7C7S1_9BACT